MLFRSSSCSVQEEQKKKVRENTGNLGSVRFFWIRHAEVKMRYYRLTPQRIKRIIRHPARLEQAIVEGAIAVMQPAYGSGRVSPSGWLADRKRYSEIWAMYVPTRDGIRVITAWRYPGRAPLRDPVPRQILLEVMRFL